MQHHILHQTHLHRHPLHRLQRRRRPLRRPQRPPPLVSPPTRLLSRLRRLRKILVRIHRLRRLRHVSASPNLGLHHPARLLGRRRLQRRRFANRVRRACSLGEVRVWLQRVVVQPYTVVAYKGTVYGDVSCVFGLEDGGGDEGYGVGVYWDVLCNWGGVGVDVGELFCCGVV